MLYKTISQVQGACVLRKTWLYPRWSVYKVATGNPFYKRKGCPHHRELYMGDVLADFSAGHHLHPHSHVRDCNACRRIPLIFLWMAKYHFAATILSEMGRSIFQHLAISFQTMCFPAAFHFQPLWPAGVQSTCHTSGIAAAVARCPAEHVLEHGLVRQVFRPPPAAVSFVLLLALMIYVCLCANNFERRFFSPQCWYESGCIASK